MNDLLLEHFSEIRDLSREYNLRTLAAYGECAVESGEEPEIVEFIVSFEDNLQLDSYAGNFFMFKKELEELLGRKVVLLVEKYLKNPYLRNIIENQKAELYG